MLEPEVARLAAERANAADVKKLEGLLSTMEDVMTRDEEWEAAELEFHGAIARATRNPVIMRIMPVIVEAIVKTVRVAPRAAEDRRKAIQEHERILKAVRERDPGTAHDAMQAHMEASFTRTVAKGAGRPQPRST